MFRRTNRLLLPPRWHCQSKHDRTAWSFLAWCSSACCYSRGWGMRKSVTSTWCLCIIISWVTALIFIFMLRPLDLLISGACTEQVARSQSLCSKLHTPYVGTTTRRADVAKENNCTDVSNVSLYISPCSQVGEGRVNLCMKSPPTSLRYMLTYIYTKASEHMLLVTSSLWSSSNHLPAKCGLHLLVIRPLFSSAQGLP